MRNSLAHHDVGIVRIVAVRFRWYSSSSVNHRNARIRNYAPGFTDGQIGIQPRANLLEPLRCGFATYRRFRL